MKLVLEDKHGWPVEKEVRDESLATAAAMAGAALLSPVDSTEVIPKPASVSKSDVLQMFPEEMRGILKQESSNGRNVRHSKVTWGLNKGDHAAGFSGLMPITVIETLQKNKSLAQYRFLLSYTKPEITAFLNHNPMIEAEIASAHWARLTRLFGDDHKRKIFAWNQGVTAAARASDDEISQHWYVLGVLGHEGTALAAR